MSKSHKRILSVLGGLVAVLGAVPATYADDTELFFTQINPSQQVNADPNVMFVIDTSGSMDGQVVTQADWDPNIQWSGSFEGDAIYWSPWGIEPSSSSDAWFNKSAFHCQAALTQMAGLGAFQDNMAAWKNGGRNGNDYSWKRLREKRKNRRVDCEDDAGVHGEGVDGAEVDPTKRYVSDGQGTGPWADTQNFTWNNQYTVWDGNYLNWKSGGGTVTQTRLEVVQQVMNNLLDTLQGVNVGMMRFNNQEGGPIVHEIAPIADARATLKSTVDAFDHAGWTPLSETLSEAKRYFTGESPYFGDCSNVSTGSCTNSTPNAISSGKYESPIEFTCQKNYVVLLTDGRPTRDTSVNSAVPGWNGFSTAVGKSSCTRDGLADDNGKCLDEIATYMQNHDLSPLQGTQIVTTHTVGFGVDLDVLEQTAQGGGGDYQLADDTSSLSIALTEIVLDIFDDATSFTAPSVPVNAFNRTQNLQDVFVSVFEPSNKMHWPGNLKKYRLINGQFTDQTGALAIDPATGFFKTSPPAQSYWSAAPDGDDVNSGGAAHEIPDWSSRNLYTNIGGNFNVPLSLASNEVSVASTLTNAQLGIPNNDPVVRQDVLEWTLGKDLYDDDDDDDYDDDRHQMGAPLHVRPVTVIYGGTAADPDAVIHTMTNDGYFHAVSARTGEEEWAFIPKRLLDRVYGLYLNGDSANVDYGLDGDIMAYVMNDDFVPGVDPSTEKVYLLFGQRRGGYSLFAVDVTLRGQPKLAWVIDPSSDAALGDLGQTWSTPTVAKVNIGGSLKHVAIVGGGYAPGQDATGYYEDSSGNAVFMVDIETGQVVWSAGDNANHDLVLNSSINSDANATMKHSIPAPIQALDLSGDGFVNRLYAADMGGRLWRFDVNNGAGTASELVDGGLLATLGAADLASPTSADVRRFYARPDAVPYIAENPSERSYISLNLGSGHRAHPLEGATSDWFFSVRDYDIFKSIKTKDYGQPIQFDDLVDITDDISPTMYFTDLGWRLKLEAASGEKVFTESLTFKGTTIFTSFTPSPPTSSCTEAVHGSGTNRLYRVNVTDGSPDVEKQPEDTDKTDRYRTLKQGGIAPGPVVFFTNHDNDGDEAPGDEGIEDGKTEADCFIGTESGGCGFTDDFVETYWFQSETQ